MASVQVICCAAWSEDSKNRDCSPVKLPSVQLRKVEGMGREKPGRKAPTQTRIVCEKCREDEGEGPLPFC